MDDLVDTRKLADALGWEKRSIDDLVDRSVVPGRRDGMRTLISLSGFVAYAAARRNAGQQMRATQQQALKDVGPDTPLIVTGLVPSRDHVHRGASNIRQYTDGHGRRVISRRDFFPNDE